jgi:hypothetical protein
MCKNFVEIKDGKVVNKKGAFRKGHWVFCDGCGIYKILKKGILLWKRS